MTGTSCDGLDAVCVAFDQKKNWRMVWADSVGYPEDLRKRALLFQDPTRKRAARDWMSLHRDLGLWMGLSIRKILKKKKIWPDVVANHGQTLAHFPEDGMTLQMGDASQIAHLTGISAISDFRSGDIAAGGQGAPLIPIFHYLLAQQWAQPHEGISIHNIGGISNLSYFGPSQGLGCSRPVLAFDTGPGGMWIDLATQKITQQKTFYDKGGVLAKSGQIDPRIVEQILELPYFQMTPPKSTGRDDFPFSLFLNHRLSHGKSLISTATEVTLVSIVRAYKTFILEKGFRLDKIVFCGGGANNIFLMNQLKKHLYPVSVCDTAKFGLKNHLVEPVGFAYLGLLSLLGTPLGGQWTGAKTFGPPGHIVPGRNWRELYKKLRIFL